MTKEINKVCGMFIGCRITVWRAETSAVDGTIGVILIKIGLGGNILWGIVNIFVLVELIYLT